MNKLLIHEEPLQVLPSLAEKIGLNEAIMLQQIHYWLRKSKHTHEGKPWIYNTYQDWGKQFPWWSDRTIKRIVTNLRDKGLIETTKKYNKINIDQTLWYTIDYDKVDQYELTEPSINPDSDKMAQSARPTAPDSDKMALPKVTEWHDHSDKLAQSVLVSDCANLSLPIPRELQESTTREEATPLPPEQPLLVPDEPTPTEKPKRARKTSKKADVETEALKEHPAVVAYRDFYNRYPQAAQMKLIAEAGIDDLETWVRAMRFVSGKGSNPLNIGYMIDLYNAPSRMDVYTNGKAETIPKPKVAGQLSGVNLSSI